MTLMSSYSSCSNTVPWSVLPWSFPTPITTTGSRLCSPSVKNRHAHTHIVKLRIPNTELRTNEWTDRRKGIDFVLALPGAIYRSSPAL
jgi:hypothetical protein